MTTNGKSLLIHNEQFRFTPTGLIVTGEPDFVTSLGELIDTNGSWVAKNKRKGNPVFSTRCIVYIVRDGAQVLYIGSTNYSARDRLFWHLRNKSSELGLAIKFHLPKSQSWVVDIYKMPNRPIAFKTETAFINELRPLLNGR